LTLTLLSPAFAPAPFPKAERAAPRKSEAALVRGCVRRLDELRVKWQLENSDGRRLLVESVGRLYAGVGGLVQVSDGDLLPALRRVVEKAEHFLKMLDDLPK
jgi:hypothetical protein